MRGKHTVGVVCVCLASVAALAYAVVVRTAEAQDADAVANTLVRGLDDRESKLRTLQGMVVIETSYDPGALANIQKAEAASGAPEDLRLTSSAVHRVAFWLALDEGQSRIEVAELSSSGMNEWGFATNYGRREPEPFRPVLTEVRRNASVTHWDLSAGRAAIKQVDPNLRDGGCHVAGKLKRYLRLGYGGIRPGRYHSADTETVEGIECDRIVHRETSRSVATIWVAPSLGFAPVRVEALSVFPNEPTRGTREVINSGPWIEASPGIWLPTETVSAVYSYLPGADTATCTISVARFSDLQVNAPIDPYRFETQLPLGTLVDDVDGTWVVGDTSRALAEAQHSALPEPDSFFMRPLQGDETEKTP